MSLLDHLNQDYAPDAILVFAIEYSMVNRTYWESSSIEIAPVHLKNRRTNVEYSPKNLFCIRFVSKSGKTWLPCDLAHIPEQLQTYFLNDDVASFASEALPAGRMASRLLPGEPNLLVCQVISKTGVVVRAMPEQLLNARRILRGCGWILCLGAIAALASNSFQVLAAIGLTVGALTIRTAADFPSY